ncbi:hypothetical protein LMG22037_06281 [Paraburkholderia phenoliruptrix]|uniref:Uncharacterized protein n=1 Tax=Paraburkholderia phenoliruptrix TaxID=252970 RepID=A0A6J5CM17_9BURK|nr:BPSL0761 family protein [Paraburkholderia phenoliruptrix]CAB3739398.1 hypothetical protein LMG22037_06281 [Paraburkholderia phenoliruptrix]
MTTPAERTKAVRATRELLQVLTEPGTVDVPGLIQTVARNLLRHYPADIDLDASASAFPEIWAKPTVVGTDELTARARVVPLFAMRADE